MCILDLFKRRGTPPEGECDTECAVYSSDANCDNDITPGDALLIFTVYLNMLSPPLECPSTLLFSLSKGFSKVELSLPDGSGVAGEKITVPVWIDNPKRIRTIGFDLSYPYELLSFVKVIPTNLTEDWQALDGQENQEGLITIGGFDPDGINK